MAVLLESARLVLREFTRADVDLLVDLDAESPGLGFWAAEDTAGAFLGWFHLRPGDGHDDSEPELGYRLRHDAWGRGYATEGSRALIDHGFTDRGVRRVFAETMAVHTASRRVMEKCGMRLLREFHADWPYPIPGDEHGDVEYVLDRADWERQRQAAARDPAVSPSCY